MQDISSGLKEIRDIFDIPQDKTFPVKVVPYFFCYLEVTHGS